MAHGSREVAAQLTETYKGIEGFYILNLSGRLGYFSSDGTRMHTERLDGIAADRASSFLETLARTVGAAPPDADKELGYLLPVDNTHLWKTATLALHDRIARALKDAFDRDISEGRISLAEGDRRVPDIASERGLHRGFEDLLNHVDSFGTRPWFPILHIQPVTAENPAHPVRVVNLLALMKDVGRFGDILAKMRQNLSERGALNQASRVEHRFTLQDEV